jgi:Domain of unknown function (DUF4249)
VRRFAIQIQTKYIMKTSFKKQYLSILSSLILSLTLTSCFDVIQLEGVKSESLLVVEAMITNQSGEQVVKLSKSQNYFDNSASTNVLNANVQVQDDLGVIYTFKDVKNNGNYVWTPANSTQKIGVIGRKYTLKVLSEGESYQATSELKRVPKIDSVLYQFGEVDQNQQIKADIAEGYEPQFYARDLKGVGDCYLIKSYKNGKVLGDVGNFLLAYDASFNKGDGADGFQFISPIRRSIAYELFKENDLVKVELFSITEDHYNFWLKAQAQIRNGGLFATPPAYITTNFFNVNKSSTKKAAGWFATVGLSTFETKIEKAKARTGLK